MGLTRCVLPTVLKARPRPVSSTPAIVRCAVGVGCRVRVDKRRVINYSHAASKLYHLTFFFFNSSGGWVKIKLKLPHFHVSDTCRVST